MKHVARITHRDRFVRGDYEGGPYIELTFGMDYYRPIEVINVYDYEKGRPIGLLGCADRQVVQAAVRLAILEWIVANDEEWPEWYEGYLDEEQKGAATWHNAAQSS